MMTEKMLKVAAVLVAAGSLAVMVGTATAAAVNDPNLLSNNTVTTSSDYLGWFPPSQAVDGTTLGACFDYADPDQRLVVSGLNTSMTLIRLWRDPGEDRIPARVLIKSSTTSDSGSLTASDYETQLADLSSISWTSGYHDFAVAAPAGTRSLYFDFGAGDSKLSSNGAFVTEVQAFAPVPEPGTLMLGATGLVALLTGTRRNRK